MTTTKSALTVFTGLLAGALFLLGASCGGPIDAELADGTNEQEVRDRTPPTVSILAPANGQTLSGIVNVSGTAADNRTVVRVEVRVDSSPYALANGTNSWSSPVDTRTFSNGSHTLTARATDSASRTTSTTVTVTVLNASSSPAGTLVISSPLTLNKTTVAPGETITGTVGYRNDGTTAFTFNSLTIAARPPGADLAAGPYWDFSPNLQLTTVQPGQTVTLTASRTASTADVQGEYFAFATVQDAAGAWSKGPNVTFNVRAPTACVPTSCSASGKNCGSLADGCGGTLSCGTCATGQTCGGGGVANVCGGASTTTDVCPAANGVSWQGKKRFMFGTNWAWKNFAGDFGGIGAWGMRGVSGDSAAFSAAIQKMKASGVNVIRWWMWPRFWTESITFGSDGVPTGIGGSLIADIHEALRLAEQHDVYIMLTPFSFDNFHPTQTVSGIPTPGLQPIVISATKTQALMNNLIRPTAQAVESSPYKKRMIAWDMINEPEWAMTGANLYGGESFSPNPSLQSVTHAQMEAFLKSMAATLSANSTALVSVGAAAIKWGSAWTRLDVDFYQVHYYDWVYQYYPYQTYTLAKAGLTDKPVVMGEFPVWGLTAQGTNPSRTAAQLSEDLRNHGYAGSLSWDYNSSNTLADSLNFANAHPCETKY